jgi:uncharacterized protein (DUF433 family)
VRRRDTPWSTVRAFLDLEREPFNDTRAIGRPIFPHSVGVLLCTGYNDAVWTARVLSDVLSEETGEAMDWRERISIDPAVLAGKPVIRGTRLAVDFVVGLLGGGWTELDVRRNYPGVTHEDIAACLQYATEILRSERMYPAAIV